MSEYDEAIQTNTLTETYRCVDVVYDLLSTGKYAVVVLPLDDAHQFLNSDSDTELRIASNRLAYAARVLGEKDAAGIGFLGRVILAHGRAKEMAKFWQEQHKHLLDSVQQIVERTVNDALMRVNTLRLPTKVR